MDIQAERKASSERISIEQYNKEIVESIADIEAGRVHSQNDVQKMIEDGQSRKDVV